MPNPFGSGSVAFTKANKGKSKALEMSERDPDDAADFAKDAAKIGSSVSAWNKKRKAGKALDSSAKTQDRARAKDGMGMKKPKSKPKSEFGVKSARKWSGR